MTNSAPSHIVLTIRHVQDKLPVREILLDDDGGTIGRAAANTVALPGDANVSLVHASLELIGSRWVLKDIGDLVPVMRNGRPLGFGQKCDIGDGDRFSIASFELQVSLNPSRIASLRANAVPVTPTERAMPSSSLPFSHAEPAPRFDSVPTAPASEAMRPADVPNPRATPLAQDSGAIPASELQRLHQDPFSQPVQTTNARNFVGNNERLLDGVLPSAEQSQGAALHNPMHFQANLDPLRHRSESIDSLFSLEAGQGVDPLADILGGNSSAPFAPVAGDEDPIMAVLNQQLGGSPGQLGSERHNGTDFGTALNLPKTGRSQD